MHLLCLRAIRVYTIIFAFFKGITFKQCQQQTKHFSSAFQYLIKPSWLLAISQICLSAIPFTTFIFASRMNYTNLVSVGLGTSFTNMIGLGVCYALALACEESAMKHKEFTDAATVIQRALFYSLSLVCFPIWDIWVNAGAIFKGLGQDPVQSR